MEVGDLLITYIDSKGKVLIKEFMDELSLSPKDRVIFTEEHGVIHIKKEVKRCFVCNEAKDDFKLYRGEDVCTECILLIKKKSGSI